MDGENGDGNAACPVVVAIRTDGARDGLVVEEGRVSVAGKDYQATHVFGPSIDAGEVYNQTTRCLVDDVLKGKGSILLVATQEDASQTIFGTPDDRGIVPTAIEHVFESVAAMEQSDTVLYTVHSSFMELRKNDEVVDLMTDEPLQANVSTRDGLYPVVDYHPRQTESVTDDDALEVLDQGLEHRRGGTTVFRLVVKKEWVVHTPGEAAGTGSLLSHSAKIDFIEVRIEEGSFGADAGSAEEVRLFACAEEAAQAEILGGTDPLLDAMSRSLLARMTSDVFFKGPIRAVAVMPLQLTSMPPAALLPCLRFADNLTSIATHPSQTISATSLTPELQAEFSLRKSVSRKALAETELPDDFDDELPANWEKGTTEDGRVYYIDHTTQSTTWEDPREVRKPAAAARKSVFLQAGDENYKQMAPSTDLPEVAIVVSGSATTDVIVKGKHLSAAELEQLVLTDPRESSPPPSHPASAAAPATTGTGLLSPAFQPSLSFNGPAAPAGYAASKRGASGREEDEDDAEIMRLIREYERVIDESEKASAINAQLKQTLAETVAELDREKAKRETTGTTTAGSTDALVTKYQDQIASLQHQLQEALASAGSTTTEAPAAAKLRDVNQSLEAEVEKLSRLVEKSNAELAEAEERSARARRTAEATHEAAVQQLKADVAKLQTTAAQKAKDAERAELRQAETAKLLQAAEATVAETRRQLDAKASLEAELTARCEALTKEAATNAASAAALKDIREHLRPLQEREPTTATLDPVMCIRWLLEHEQTAKASFRKAEEARIVEQQLRQSAERRLADVKESQEGSLSQLKEAYTKNHKDILQWFCTKQHNMIKQLHQEYTNEVKTYKAQCEQAQSKLKALQGARPADSPPQERPSGNRFRDAGASPGAWMAEIPGIASGTATPGGGGFPGSAARGGFSERPRTQTRETTSRRQQAADPSSSSLATPHSARPSRSRSVGDPGVQRNPGSSFNFTAAARAAGKTPSAGSQTPQAANGSRSATPGSTLRRTASPMQRRPAYDPVSPAAAAPAFGRAAAVKAHAAAAAQRGNGLAAAHRSSSTDTAQIAYDLDRWRAEVSRLNSTDTILKNRSDTYGGVPPYQL